MAPRRVRCRSVRSAAVAWSRSRLLASRASKAAGGSSFTRDAASSMARGRPSNLRQISTIEPALASLSSNSGRTARARCTNRATDSLDERPAMSPASAIAGMASGGTLYSCSPLTCRTERLVTTSLSRSAPSSRALTVLAAGRTCSKLSRTINASDRARRPTRVSMAGRPSSSPKPSAWRIVGATSSGELMAASWTNATPSSNSAATSRVNRCASLVLPVPPGPVSVSSRVPARSSRARASSRPRPMNVVTSAGSRSKRVAWARIGGNWLGSPSMTS